MHATPEPQIRGRESQTISERLARIVAESQRRPGRDVTGLIRLDNGDPSLSVPAAVERAMRAALSRDETHYGPPFGLEQLRQAIGRHLSANRSEPVGADQTLVTHGATAALFAAVVGVVNSGDQVLIPEPSYSIFPDVVRFAEGDPVLLPTRSNFHLDLDLIEAHATKARMIILCNPSSPTGVIYTTDELRAVGQIALRHRLLVLADEVYTSTVFDRQAGTSLLDVPGIRDLLFYAQSFSKAYAMTGLRVGFLAAPPWAFEACARAHHLMNGPLSSLVQRAALAALAVGPGWMTRSVHTLARRRDLLLGLIRNDGSMKASTPNAGLFVWARHNRPTSSAAFVEEAARAGVAIRSGTEFGPSGDGFVAITFAVDDKTLMAGFGRLLQVLHEH